MFSAIGIIFICGIYFAFKKFKNRPQLFLILFFLIFLGFSFLTNHKEERYVLPLVIPICIFSAIFVYKIDAKKVALVVLAALVFLSLLFQFNTLVEHYYDGTDYCFIEAINYMKNSGECNHVINDESSVLYYYLKKPFRSHCLMKPL